MAKILITGVGGFTGLHLLNELRAANHDVCGLSHRPMPELPIQVYEADLLNRDALVEVVDKVKPEVVIHLAAIAFVAHGDIRAIYETNVIGTRNLLDAICAANCSPKSVLLASSANIYGNANCEVLDESVVPGPVNDYAVSKLAMEYVARLWMDKLPITIVRPFNYTGVGQATNFLLPKIVSHFRERKPVIELGNLDVIRDFSDVRYVSSAYARLATGAFSGEIFNICSGKGRALKEVLAAMEEFTGHHPEIRVNPAFVRANEVHKLIGSNEKLVRAVGELPYTDLNDTLRWMLAE